MRFNVNKVEEINKAFAAMIDPDHRAAELKIGDNGLDEKSAVYLGNWFICNVEDIDVMVQGLRLLGLVVQDKTGVML